MRKILIITPTSNQVVEFRKNLIEDFKKNNYQVSVLTLDDKEKEEIEKRDIDFYCLKDTNRSINPLNILSLKNRYAKIIKQINPDVVFTFMLKPNTFGCLAAKKAGVKNIYCMVEGIGDPFIYNTLKWKIIRLVVSALYRKSLKNSKKVFFLNNDDKQEFIDRKLVKENQCEVVYGIGVDLERFIFKPIKNDRTFLMIARMLQTKGVYEYCECARKVKQKYPDAIFNYLGAEGTVKLSDIQSYIDDGSINYLGMTKDVRPFINECTALILPSYGEGMPVTVMEAESSGRMVIVTNTNGCRDTVIENENGFLIPVKNIDKLVDKVVWCIENLQEVKKMGQTARGFAEKNFNQIIINNKILRIIKE